MADEIFNAANVSLAVCHDPPCRGIHVVLVDDAGVSRAQFVILSADLEAFICDLRFADAHVPDAGRGLH